MKGVSFRPRSPLTRILLKFLLSLVGIFVLATPLFYYLTKYYYAEDMQDLIEAVRAGHEIPELDLEADIMVGMTIQYGVILFVLCIGVVLTFFLMQKEQRIYQAQKEFTENASHELQTPLAIIRSKLDILIQSEHDESSARIIDELYRLNSRMERLNRNLLLLAKIENGQYVIAEEVVVGDFVRGLLSGYQSLYPHCVLRMDKAGCVKVKANVILLECLLNNLAANAIRHTADKKSDIVITLLQDGISVSNPAQGKALDESVLFERFRKGDAGEKGCGLGLAIVKAIADYHGWTVCYRYLSGVRQHCFMVKFF